MDGIGLYLREVGFRGAYGAKNYLSFRKKHPSCLALLLTKLRLVATFKTWADIFQDDLVLSRILFWYYPGYYHDIIQDDLVKINVYYDSLNEKSVMEKIDYSLEVSEIQFLKQRQLWWLLTQYSQYLQYSQYSGREFLFGSGGLCLPLARYLLLQVSPVHHLIKFDSNWFRK